MAFDGERIELMSPSEDHDEIRMRVNYIVPSIAGVLGVICKGVGSTTRKQAPSRGLEPDTSFHMTAEKARACASTRPEARPIRSPRAHSRPCLRGRPQPHALDRPAIYAALGVPEIWRYDGERVRIERLKPEGVYESVPESGWLEVRPGELARLLTEEWIDDNEFMDHVKAWARDVLLPRRGGAAIVVSKRRSGSWYPSPSGAEQGASRIASKTWTKTPTTPLEGESLPCPIAAQVTQRLENTWTNWWTFSMWTGLVAAAAASLVLAAFAR